MSVKNLQETIEKAWEDRAALEPGTKGAVPDAVREALNLLDSGRARIAEKKPEGWQTNQWLKKAVLLSFRLNAMRMISGGAGGGNWYDKVESKFKDWSSGDFAFQHSGIRSLEFT